MVGLMLKVAISLVTGIEVTAKLRKLRELSLITTRISHVTVSVDANTCIFGFYYGHLIKSWTMHAIDQARRPRAGPRKT